MGHEFHELTRIKFSTASDGFTAARGCADWGFTDEREAALPIVREILRALLSEFSRRTRPEFCTLEAPLECGSLLPPWFGAERGEESFRVKAQSSSEPLHACFVNQTCARHVWVAGPPAVRVPLPPQRGGRKLRLLIIISLARLILPARMSPRSKWIFSAFGAGLINAQRLECRVAWPSRP